MKIIPADKTHIPVIRQIAFDTWFDTYSQIQSREQLEYMLDWMYNFDSLAGQMDKKGHCFLLIKENGKYMGYASYELNYEDTKETKIHKLYVLPDNHKSGLGRRLVEEIEKIACKNENTAILLDVNKKNKAVGFYQKLGFTISGEKCTDIGRGFCMDDYIMKKILDSQ